MVYIRYAWLKPGCNAAVVDPFDRRKVWRMKDIKLGSQGESLAEKYLKKKGYLMIERNFRCKYGEIDIIAMDGPTLVFVEVKTRRSLRYGLPCEAVNDAKIRHLKRMVSYYMTVCGMENRDARIDVIEILMEAECPYLRHIENITG